MPARFSCPRRTMRVREYFDRSRKTLRQLDKNGGHTMTDKRHTSRREFVASAISMAAVSCLPVGGIFGETPGHVKTPMAADGTNERNWRDEGIEDLTKSPHAKLHDIPVRAVTISGNFWARRREINVDRSIPTMHDLL